MGYKVEGDMAGEVEKAEEIGQLRIVMLAMMAVALALAMVMALRTAGASESQRAFGVPVYGWQLLVVAGAALLIATGGGIFQPRRMRDLLDDEVTRANRRRGMAVGFWAMLVIATIGYALSIPELGARIGVSAPSMGTLAKVVVLGGEAAALGCFAWWEAMAHRHG